MYHVVRTVPGFADTRKYFDMFDRIREHQTAAMNNQWIKKVYSYDKLGRKKTTTTPFYNSSSAVVTTFGYDAYDRPTSSTSTTGTTNYFYSTNGTMLLKGTAHINGMVTFKEVDAAGKVLKSTDNGGVLDFQYDSWGNLTKTSLDGNTKTISVYDAVFGRQTSLQDMDAGTTQYKYNAYGELVSQTDANGNTRVSTYDVMGKPLTKTGPEGTTIFDYVTSGNGLNKIKKLTGFNGLTKEYEYDNYDRLQKLSIPYLSGFNTTYSYDGYGHMVHTFYSTDVHIMKNYDANGYVEKIYSVENDIVNQQSVLVTLFEAPQMNPFGMYSQYKAGNGITSYISYNDHGLPTFYNGGNGAVQYLQLDWDNAQGNLTKRTDHIKGLAETFVYDSMDRLHYANVNGGPSISTTFDPNGNIDFHGDVEDFQYYTGFDDGRIKKIANPNTDISLNTQATTYTPFNEPNDISEGTFNLKFNYGPDGKRIQSLLKENGQVTEVRSYVPEASFETVQEDGIRKNLHYVHFGDKIGVVIIKCESINDGGGNSGGGGEEPIGGDMPEGDELGSDGPGPQPIGVPGCDNDYNYFYTYTDHLGSILTVTNKYGNIIAEQSFDAWGRYRDPDTWNYISTPANLPNWLIRGYTAHEHLDEFEVIHMNGRLYAPKTGRFFSPDNHVQSPFNTQSYNRYAYVFNNPMKYTDADGEVAGLAIVAFLVFTEPGYELQKLVSPVALRVNVHLGTHNRGIGADVSLGVPKILPLSYRRHYGATYYTKTLGGRSGWETRVGGEWAINGYLFGIPGSITYSGTTFRGLGYPREQTTNTLSIGNPLLNLSYENDTRLNGLDFSLPGVPRLDPGSDGYRTAAARIQVWPLSLGMILHTGEEDATTRNQIQTDFKDRTANVMTGGSINDPGQRNGILYLGIGNIRIGADTESIRHVFQNRFAHDLMNGGNNGSSYPWILTLDKQPRLYFQFGSGSGNQTLY